MSFWDDLGQRYTSSSGGADWGNLLGDASNLQYKNGYEQDYGALGRAIDAGNRPKTTGTEDEMGPPSPPGSPSFMGPGNPYRDSINEKTQAAMSPAPMPQAAPPAQAAPSMDPGIQNQIRANAQAGGAMLTGGAGGQQPTVAPPMEDKSKDNEWVMDLVKMYFMGG